MKKISFLLAILFLGITAIAQQLNVNSSKSELKWTGEKVTGGHWGFIKLNEGNLNLNNGKIAGGVFIIDMQTITNKDLEDEQWNKKLIGHLKSDDFFSVEKFPTAKLVITGSTPFNNEIAEVEGKLTIKGITHPISFKVQRNGNIYTSSIKVDRTKYNVRYGSGKFFDNLGDNMIYDEFTLDVKIFTE